MRTILAIVSLLIVLTLNGQELLSTVTYKKKTMFNLENIKDVKAKTLLQNVNSAVKDLEFKLVFSLNESFFSELEKLDSEKTNALSNNLARKMGIGNGIFYMNTIKDRIIIQKSLSSDLFLIESEIESQKWKKTNETKQIGKYACFKATTTVLEETVSAGTVEREVIAWYTPQIPAPFGPAGFGGLPGLILEIQKGQFILYAEKISLNAKTEKIKVPKRGIKVSKKEFREIQKKGSAYYRQYKN